MNTPLQNVNLTANDLTAPVLADTEETVTEVEHHIHMPNPSFWPLLLAISICLALGSILFVNNVIWLPFLFSLFVLIFMIAWALEDPFAPRTGLAGGRRLPLTYTEASEVGRPTALAEALLEDAQDVADRTVTVSSTAWSAHPVKVEIEREGVVLALYGKVELEAQSKELEQTLLKMPGVLDVKNFLVAEDTLLNAANERIEKLRAAGKLEGAKNISVLVENYIINLYGETPTSQMKYLLEKELVGIPGVRVVVNHIGLNTDIPGNLGKTNNKIGK